MNAPDADGELRTDELRTDELRKDELRKELDATLHTRRDLGPEYENELIEGFLEKVEQRVDAAIDKRVRRQLAEQQMMAARGGVRPRQSGSPSYPAGFGSRFGLASVSLVLAIPLSAIAVANAGVAGLATCWAGIAAVNGFQACRSRGKRDDEGGRRTS